MALLRAVNLAGRNNVAMGDLRTLLSDLGFENPRSLLQSGNLVFESKTRSTSRLEGDLERAVTERLGLTTEFFVRTAAEWQRIVTANPFPEEARRDPAHLLLMLLRKAPAAAGVSALQRAISGREVVRAEGRQAYVVYPDGVGRSRLTSTLIEKHLGTRVTGRNWNTVLKLDALASGS